MILVKTDQKVNYYKFTNLSNYEGFVHFVSTRNGGVSKPPFHSLNLGLKVDDVKMHVILNRQMLAEAVGVDFDKLAIPSQCHSNNICIVTPECAGKGVYEKDDAISDTDALITNIPGICLMIFAADCVPVLIYDPVKKVIAAAHAGWKGTVNKIVCDVVQKMNETFGSVFSDIIAGIGPSIGPCCYNIGDDVIEKVKQSFGPSASVLLHENDTTVLDLWKANQLNLISSGVPEHQIEISELCTSCHSDLFFSHRKSGGLTGRFGAGIMLQKK